MGEQGVEVEAAQEGVEEEKERGAVAVGRG